MRRNYIKSLRLLLFVSLLAAIAVAIASEVTLRAIYKEGARSAPVRRPARATLIAKPKLTIDQIKLFPFTDSAELNEWEEKVFKGRVAYIIEKSDSLSFVDAKSAASASAMYYKVKLDPKGKRPVIRWKWRVEKFPVKTEPESLETQAEHDFAGRVYVIFPAMFILNSEVIEYIWAEKLPIGSIGTSPYSGHIRLMVLESGPPKGNAFTLEERDIVADYIKAFGCEPRRGIGAVAFMTNAEHTKTSAEANYDDIEVGYKK